MAIENLFLAEASYKRENQQERYYGWGNEDPIDVIIIPAEKYSVAL